jgi:cytochrome c biogenesis protein CcdA
MQQDLVGLAFAAGLVVALNPCGFAMLPAYLTLVVRDEGTRELVAVGRALAATTAMALGFLTVFGTFGLLTLSAASTVQRYLPYATVLIGVVLVALGIWMLAGRRLAIRNPFFRSSRWGPTTRIGSMFGYGIGYAIASLSCTIGPFLAVTAASFRGGRLLNALWIYLAYGAGFTLIVGVLAIATAFARSTLAYQMRRIVPYVNRISGAPVVLVGLYVGYYGIYEVRLFDLNGIPSDPVIAAATRIQGTLAAWVHQHGAWPWVQAMAVLVALAAAALIWRHRVRWRSPTGCSPQISTAPTPVVPPNHPQTPSG